jgi:hypothetical protein
MPCLVILTETWLSLARELDGAQAFLDAMNGIEVGPVEARAISSVAT